jgi:hypothetical protein
VFLVCIARDRVERGVFGYVCRESRCSETNAVCPNVLRSGVRDPMSRS